MRSRWLFLPVLGAPALHAPVLRFDWLRGFKRPIDGGLTWRGRRLLGDNKTWRGAVVMITGVLTATLLLSPWDWWWSELPSGIRDAGPVVFGVLLGVGTVLDELPNSFLKRQLGIPPGQQRSLLFTIYDQADFVLVIWIVLLPLWTMSVWQAAFVFAVVTAVHLVINVIGYAIGARTAPI